jgi:hypothetical protein
VVRIQLENDLLLGSGYLSAKEGPQVLMKVTREIPDVARALLIYVPPVLELVAAAASRGLDLNCYEGFLPWHPSS